MRDAKHRRQFNELLKNYVEPLSRAALWIAT